jgi:cupin 2 domain-containing protein
MESGREISDNGDMPPLTKNLLAVEPGATTGERTTTLLEGQGFRLEHISSYGAASLAGFWYDQEKPEWVMLIQGEAVLQFAGGENLRLQAGDAFTIPARCKHRVEAVSADAVWLALHFTPAHEK